jgi:hypothetical protein
MESVSARMLGKVKKKELCGEERERREWNEEICREGRGSDDEEIFLLGPSCCSMLFPSS